MSADRLDMAASEPIQALVEAVVAVAAASMVVVADNELATVYLEGRQPAEIVAT